MALTGVKFDTDSGGFVSNCFPVRGLLRRDINEGLQSVLCLTIDPVMSLEKACLCISFVFVFSLSAMFATGQFSSVRNCKHYDFYTPNLNCVTFQYSVCIMFKIKTFIYSYMSNTFG